ncbi:hypothetical protein BDN71DRAFT_1450751 [Pleurotus eryngii]|uniref:Mitochondrial chaperone BCS1 n=1 Tax=Pleurotus eryngii TaxID=5323 RepID=A0A9P5ZT57_PLEER|nr:hypothetical protein BDN71DRAFT_1450751 [Pleurotus eryngii]
MDYQSLDPGLPAPVTAGSAVNGLLANSMTLLGLGSMLKSVFPSLAGQFSTSQISNSIKLFLLGSTIELGRRSWQWIYTRFRPKLFISATFLDGDPVHEWIMIFLAQKRVWYHARDYTIQYKTSTQQWGVTVIRPEEARTQGDVKDVEELEETVSFLPNYGTPQLFRWNGYWVEVIREAPQTQGLPHEVKTSTGAGTLRLNLYTLNQCALRDLIQEAKLYYIAESKQQVVVRSLGVNQGMMHGIFGGHGKRQFWTDIKKKPYRPLDSVILPQGVLGSIVNDAREFITSEHWYTRAGIPYRRGYLFHGPPGTGKSSTVYALAGALGLELYTLSLSTSGLTDVTLQMAADNIPKRGILLIEDIDCAFPSRDDEEEQKQAQAKASASRVAENMMMGIPPPPGRSSVTMSGLLNVLDGVNSENGKIFMATTNYVDRLDDALLRPGRIDMKVEYKLASKDQAAAIFNRFFAVPEEVQGLSKKMPYEGSVHHPLADEFASRFPDNEFTVAELQGYLLSFRMLPNMALNGISAWITREREERLAKSEREKQRKAKAKEAKEDVAAQIAPPGMPPMFQGIYGLPPSPAPGSTVVGVPPPPTSNQSGLGGDKNGGSDKLTRAPPLDAPTAEEMKEMKEL